MINNISSKIDDEHNRELYTIDFRNVKHYLEMHLEIRRALDFPDYYGCNWDAFWDCLTEVVGEPLHIEIYGLEVIERKFGDSAERMLSILKRLKHWHGDAYRDSIRIEIITGDVRTSLN